MVTYHEDADLEESKRVESPPLSNNPMLGKTDEEIVTDANTFVDRHGLEVYRQTFQKAGLVLRREAEGASFLDIAQLSHHDKKGLQYEAEHKWKSAPKMLFFLCALCAGCAVVQGMDQTVINGAQEFYFEEFGITDRLMQGLINGAPYASASLVGCWLNGWLNSLLGRRGVIFVSCAVAAITAIWQAAAPTWVVLFTGRLALGVAVGAKSSTTPIYASECAPKAIRGGLVMMWQMWTAFGIMLGFIISLAFHKVDFLGQYSQWRWMLGITAFPPLLVCCLVYTLPESPRWYMEKDRIAEAFWSMRMLRTTELQAARDLYMAAKMIELEDRLSGSKASFPTKLKEFFTVRRNRRAAQSAWFVMFMQQFCGINVIAYYSTKIFRDIGFSHEKSLLMSFGTGTINFLFAIPAIFIIDKFGRRRLLTSTFPLLAICLYLVACGFFLGNGGEYFVLVALYVFIAVYSVGMGPVPFTYSAEVFSLRYRAAGMASATAVTWAFNFLISFTWPIMMATMTAQGGFFFYATWNVVGFLFAYFFIPETKGISLEELDNVFSVRNRDFMHHQTLRLRQKWQKVRGANVDPLPPMSSSLTINSATILEPEPEHNLIMAEANK